MTTKIEWTDETWNPVTGCTPISDGCKNCYAKRMARRLAGRFGYPEAPHHFDVTLHPDRLELPLRWRKPRRVFVCSMSDLFHNAVPFSFINRVWRRMDNCAHHTFQILTKRPNQMVKYFEHRKRLSFAMGHHFSNVWLGVTICNASELWKITPLRDTPAAVRFISFEPLLKPVNPNLDGIDWVICGAETGPRKRPMQLDWARSLRDQCQAAGVPFFFKKDSNGNHTLDGYTYEEFPQ